MRQPRHLAGPRANNSSRLRHPATAELEMSSADQMPITQDEERAHRASNSIMAVAVVQLVGSVALLILSGLFLAEDLQLHHLYPSTYRALHPAVYLYYIILPITFPCWAWRRQLGFGSYGSGRGNRHSFSRPSQPQYMWKCSSYVRPRFSRPESAIFIGMLLQGRSVC